MKGVIYCRVSTKEQVDGTSLTTQRTACLRYAEMQGIIVEKIFEEEGESAKFRDRTQLLALIEFCRTRKDIQSLIVWKVDRFARNVEDHFIVKRELLKYGTVIHSVTEPISDSPIGRFTETIFAAMAECDNGIRAHRCVEGMQRKIESGIFPWKPPIGYLSANPIKTKKHLPDIPDPARFATVQKAWQLLLSGNSKADIVRFFRSRNLTNGSGNPISANLVDVLFNNKYYAGVLTDPWTNAEYPAQHEAMVTFDEFAQVQRLLSGRSRRLPHVRMRSDLPLRGFVRCRACLHPLTGSWSTGRSKRYAYYHCYWKECRRRGKGTSRDILEMEFITTFRKYMPRPKLLSLLRGRIEREMKIAQTAVARTIAPQRSRLSVLLRENQELIEMRRRKLITDDEFVRDHEALKMDINNVQALIGDTEAASSIESKDIEQLLTLFASLPDNWNRIHPKFRLWFQHHIFYEGVVEGQFGTAKTSDVFTLFGENQRQKPNGVHHSVKFWNRVLQEFVRLKAFVQSSTVFIEPPDTAPNKAA